MSLHIGSKLLSRTVSKQHFNSLVRLLQNKHLMFINMKQYNFLKPFSMLNIHTNSQYNVSQEISIMMQNKLVTQSKAIFRHFKVLAKQIQPKHGSTISILLSSIITWVSAISIEIKTKWAQDVFPKHLKYIKLFKNALDLIHIIIEPLKQMEGVFDSITKEALIMSKYKMLILLLYSILLKLIPKQN